MHTQTHIYVRYARAYTNTRHTRNTSVTRSVSAAVPKTNQLWNICLLVDYSSEPLKRIGAVSELLVIRMNAYFCCWSKYKIFMGKCSKYNIIRKFYCYQICPLLIFIQLESLIKANVAIISEVEHIFFSCLTHYQTNLFRNLSMIGVPFSTSFHLLLTNPNLVPHVEQYSQIIYICADVCYIRDDLCRNPSF